MEKIVVGIDVGTTKIAVFIGQRDAEGKISIIGMGKTESDGVERGVVKNITLTANAIKLAVEQAEAMANYQVRDVYVGIAGHHIKSLHHRGNIMIPEDNHIITIQDVDKLKKDQNNLMLSPGEEIIHVVAQSYSVDGDLPTSNPIGRVGKCLEGDFNLITGNVTDIQNIYHSVRLAGYNVKDLFLEPIASAEAVIDETEKDAGICLVDIGGGTTDIAIFKGGILRHTAVIPLAGNVITEDIKEGCSIIKTQAEALKINFGRCLETDNSQNEIISIPGFRGRESREISVQTLSNIIKARVTMILDQVRYEIHSTDYDKKLIAGIVLTGGGAKIKDIVQLTEFMTGLDARIGTPNDHLSGTVTEDMKHPMHATGIGLVLKGFQLIDEENRLLEREDDKTELENKEPESNSEELKSESALVDEGEKKLSIGDRLKGFFRFIVSDEND